MTNQVIPEAAVEAAAKAEYEHEFLMLEGVWEKVPDEVKALFRESAKVALEAAAPHLTERAYNAGHLDGMIGSPNTNPYRTAK